MSEGVVQGSFEAVAFQGREVALDGSSMDDVLIGEVGIKDYGDKDNEELGTRYAGRSGSYFINSILEWCSLLICGSRDR